MTTNARALLTGIAYGTIAATAIVVIDAVGSWLTS